MNKITCAITLLLMLAAGLNISVLILRVIHREPTILMCALVVMVTLCAIVYNWKVMFP